MSRRTTSKLPSAKEAARMLEQDAVFSLQYAIGKDGELSARLSPAARRHLEAIATGVPNGERRARNLYALAKALGTCKETLRQRRLQFPGFPEPNADHSYNVAAVKKWWDSAGGNAANSKAVVNGTDEEVLSAKASLDLEHTKIKLERERYSLEVAQRDYLKRDEVNECIEIANTVIMRALVKAFVHDLPPLQGGLTAAEIQVMNEERLNEVFREIPKHIAAARPREGAATSGRRCC